MATTKQGSDLADDVARWFEDRAARRDPYALYARLRRENPVHYVPFPQVRQLAALPVRWDPARAAA